MMMMMLMMMIQTGTVWNILLQPCTSNGVSDFGGYTPRGVQNSFKFSLVQQAVQYHVQVYAVQGLAQLPNRHIS
eukprot:2754159-Amphidinium_carterae.2